MQNINEEEVRTARKQQASWMVSSAVARLTRLCAPKCLTYQEMQMSSAETRCLENCLRSLHGSHEQTLDYFKQFESN